MRYYFECPHCGQDEFFFHVNQASDGTGCAILMLGGLLPALLYQSSRANQIQCGGCGYIFPRPAIPCGPVANSAKWLLIILILLWIMGAVFVLNPELVADAPGWLAPTFLIQAISKNSRAFAVMITAETGLVTIVSISVGVTYSLRHRNEIGRYYKVEPENRI
jgi:hypothetical protein